MVQAPSCAAYCANFVGNEFELEFRGVRVQQVQHTEDGAKLIYSLSRVAQTAQVRQGTKYDAKYRVPVVSVSPALQP